MGVRLNIKHFAALSLCFAVIVALLNLYMNLMVHTPMPDFQLDMNVDSDLFGFHQPQGPFHDDMHRNAQKSHHEVATDKNVLLQPKSDDDGVLHCADKRPCLGICSHRISVDMNQSVYVDTLITRGHNSRQMKTGSKFGFTNVPYEWPPDVAIMKNFVDVWRNAERWVKSRQITPVNQDFTKLLFAMNRASVRRADLSSKGVQVKLILELDGGQEVLFKPKLYNRSVVFDWPPYAGGDRHNGEIAAFHLARLLGLNRVPVAVGRRLDFQTEIFRVATSALLDSIFQNKEQQQCFYRRGRCQYCSKQYAACCDTSGPNCELEGAIILWLPDHSTVQPLRSAWARTYKENKFADWETDPCFCAKIFEKSTMGKGPLFYDIVDAAIFDYLIGNADRHNLELVGGAGVDSFLALMDNGKSFGNPNVDEITILAPLYQCCKLRRRMHETLKYFEHVDLAAALAKHMQTDPISPLLTEAHLHALNRRLTKVLVLVQMCFDRHGHSAVLHED